jgi:hypothetical protein
MHIEFRKCYRKRTNIKQLFIGKKGFTIIKQGSMPNSLRPEKLGEHAIIDSKISKAISFYFSGYQQRPLFTKGY